MEGEEELASAVDVPERASDALRRWGRARKVEQVAEMHDRPALEGGPVVWRVVVQGWAADHNAWCQGWNEGVVAHCDADC